MVNCSVCNEEFEDEAELEQHTKEKHRKKKNHVYKECGKEFKQSSKLNWHVGTYTGEKPYQCQYYDKGFAK